MSRPFAYGLIFSIAIVPGFMNAFLFAGLLMDRRPKRAPVTIYPGLSILVAAYNEQDSILGTIESIAQQHYPGALEVIVINDGSTDETQRRLEGLKYPWLTVVDLQHNLGKAKALNIGLATAKFPLLVTLDGDSSLHRDALVNIVGRLLSEPPDTASIAGAVFVKNHAHNLVTKTQNWDYLHGISSVKRVQSMFHGTLVAQGAFSLYRTEVLRQIGGWPDCVGEDIVLTWTMLRRGHRVGLAEDACAFTDVPATLLRLIRQRQRWARGLIEAFRAEAALLFSPRLCVVFVWWNLLFPALDLAYTLFFIPGFVLAALGYYWIVGPTTLFVLPLALLMNGLMFVVQVRTFRQVQLKIRGSAVGFLTYCLLYGVLLQPACVIGYLRELLGTQKQWATK